MAKEWYGLDSDTLLRMYGREISVLKSKLLEGEAWENLKVHRRNIAGIAMALYDSGVPTRKGNPAEFPYLGPENPS
jgi:hypothetical protein